MKRFLTTVLSCQLVLCCAGLAVAKHDYLQLSELEAQLDLILKERIERPTEERKERPTEERKEGPTEETTEERTEETTKEASVPLFVVLAKDASQQPGKQLVLRNHALSWFDYFETQQPFLSATDIAKMRTALLALTEPELKRWMDSTAELQEASKSSAWKDTCAWLKEFFEVQAIYDDQRMEKFRERIKQLSAEEYLYVMGHFANQYYSRVDRARFAEMRRRALNVRPTSVTSSNVQQISYPRSSGGFQVRNRRVVAPRRSLSNRIKNWVVYRNIWFFN